MMINVGNEGNDGNLLLDAPCICIAIALNRITMTITMMKRMEWIMINAGNDDDLLELCQCCKTLHVIVAL